MLKFLHIKTLYVLVISKEVTIEKDSQESI